MAEIIYRYQRLKDAGCKPFPMVYNRENKELRRFGRWVIRRYDEIVPWEEFNKAGARERPVNANLPLGIPFDAA